jgi:glycosyltransferase involved in cell wall biosynthesis
MKLLICTQAVDSRDSNLGFFHTWISEFAKHCDEVVVICLREGEHALPQNVRVLSLGKEQGKGRAVRAWRFLKYIRTNEYDAVFVHMNPEYVLLGGRYWQKHSKKIGLWYAHKSVTWKLNYAVRLLDRVFTVSSNSFQIQTPKLRALGHGIDTELFRPAMHTESNQLRIITAGRLAESKRLLEMIAVLDVLHAAGQKFSFTIAGEAGTPAEEAYTELLRAEIAKRPYQASVHFVGAVPHHELADVLRKHDVQFNFGVTGNMDKAGLEALAAGIPLFSTNEHFRELLEPWGLYVGSPNPEVVADALVQFFNRGDQPAIIATLRNKVVAQHSLANLIPKILKELQ